MPPKKGEKNENVGDERLEAEEADFETSKGVNVVATFDGMKLREDLLRGIYAYGTPHRFCTSKSHPGAPAAFSIFVAQSQARNSSELNCTCLQVSRSRPPSSSVLLFP